MSVSRLCFLLLSFVDTIPPTHVIQTCVLALWICIEESNRWRDMNFVPARQPDQFNFAPLAATTYKD